MKPATTMRRRTFRIRVDLRIIVCLVVAALVAFTYVVDESGRKLLLSLENENASSLSSPRNVVRVRPHNKKKYKKDRRKALENTLMLETGSSAVVGSSRGPNPSENEIQRTAATWPPLSSVLDNTTKVKRANITANVEFILDFAIIGRKFTSSTWLIRNGPFNTPAIY